MLSDEEHIIDEHNEVVARLEAKIAKLRTLLRPFADYALLYAEEMSDDCSAIERIPSGERVTIGDFRRANQALTQ